MGKWVNVTSERVKILVLKAKIMRSKGINVKDISKELGLSVSRIYELLRKSNWNSKG